MIEIDATAPRSTPDDKRLVVVLDLDETLIYATEDPLDHPAAFVAGPYSVYLRPHLHEFLNAVADEHRVALWTASSASYAALVLNNIFPPDYPLLFAWSRERCTYRLDRELAEPVWSKELRKLWRRGYPKQRLVVVDDSPEKLLRSYGNHVLIPAWLGSSDDNALLRLPQFLCQLSQAPDVRTVEKRRWLEKRNDHA